MGQWFSYFFVRKKTVVVIGLDGAGKTALTNYLAYGEAGGTVPTMGLNVHMVQRGNTVLEMIDCCGQTNMRLMWQTIYRTADAVVFVVDGADHNRLDEVKREIQTYTLDMSMYSKPFMLLVNKQDIPDAFNANTLKENINGECWRAFDICVKSGEGIDGAMHWLMGVI